jgi:hypothetical protein
VGIERSREVSFVAIVLLYMSPHSFLRIWAALCTPLLFVGTFVLLIVYVNDQQNIRLGANEPQEWMAHDTAEKIASGVSPTRAVIGAPVVVMSEHAPYLIAYDKAGSTTAATGIFEGKVSTLPIGVLQHTRDHGTHRLTWEPEPGIRHAIVIVPIQGGDLGYVLSGRSLSYAEQQEELLRERTIYGWLLTLVVSVLVSLVGALLLRKKN